MILYYEREFVMPVTSNRRFVKIGGRSVVLEAGFLGWQDRAHHEHLRWDPLGIIEIVFLDWTPG
jgi:hypothetical protein